MGPLASVDYAYSWVDDPTEHRLRVSFTSKSKRRLCLGRDEWPSSGSLWTESGPSVGVYLFVGKRILAYKNTEYSGYCVELNCFNPVHQGESRSGYLSYDGFGLPDSDYAATKKLKYKPRPFWCD